MKLVGGRVCGIKTLSSSLEIYLWKPPNIEEETREGGGKNSTKILQEVKLWKPFANVVLFFFSLPLFCLVCSLGLVLMCMLRGDAALSLPTVALLSAQKLLQCFARVQSSALSQPPPHPGTAEPDKPELPRLRRLIPWHLGASCIFTRLSAIFPCPEIEQQARR